MRSPPPCCCTSTRSGAWRGAVESGLRPPRSFPERTYGSTSPTRESATWPTCYSWKICSAPSGSSVGLASVGSSMRWRSGGRPALLVQWQRTAERRRLLVRLLRQQKDEKAKGQSRRGPPPRPRKRSQVLPARRSGLLLMPAVLLAPGSPVAPATAFTPPAISLAAVGEVDRQLLLAPVFPRTAVVALPSFFAGSLIFLVLHNALPLMRTICKARGRCLLFAHVWSAALRGRDQERGGARCEEGDLGK